MLSFYCSTVIPSVYNRWSKNYFQISRRRKASPTTSTSSINFRNACFWFCSWFKL